MNDLTHQQLLRDYAESRSEAAFADLVGRHVDFVYSAALRILRDPHLAEDVTQSVFLALAKNARQLADRPFLLGWLHRTVQNLAANAIRSEVRRRAREQAATMNQSLSTEHDTLWRDLAPLLDAAIGDLSEPDRDVVLLRYFEQKSAREIGQVCGISDEAAQKRVTRAVERLRDLLAKRGITVGVSGLIILMGGNGVHAAPAGLVATISTALAGTALPAAITATAPQAIAMTTLQKTLVLSVLTAAIGTGVYEGAQNSKLRDQVQTLQQKQGLQQSERDETANRLAALQAENESLKSNRELLQLRGEIARLRDAANRAIRAEAELARLKSAQQGSTAATEDSNSSPDTLVAYLGDPVPPPSNLEPAYTREGLMSALQQAAQLAGVLPNRLEIDTSEFPFLAGVVCESEADFDKLKAQFKNMQGYEYDGATSSHGIYAFNITPHRSFPSETSERISRRMTLRMRMFYDQLAAR